RRDTLVRNANTVPACSIGATRRVSKQAAEKITAHDAVGAVWAVGIDAPYVRVALVERARAPIAGAFRNLPELADPLPVAKLIGSTEVVWLVADDAFAELLTSTYAVKAGTLPQILRPTQSSIFPVATIVVAVFA
ncbi:MAG TPA: hypothetical protein VFG22_04425, partial [Polyangiales bacterium]|nr:hypothetical protein [Polyangiales bacterium]